MRALVLVFSLGFTVSIPPANPPWPPTYNMSMSTITMQCNSSGWSDPQRGAAFGIVSYDWSNAKAQWAAAKPMDCEERLQEQARTTKALNPASHVFVYRNAVKALPWFSTVREKLNDPAYSGWFLKFSGKRPYHVPDCALENSSKCSIFYHDQEQTPEVPTPKDPNPDGSCTEGVCDCGVHPCGEYLFDHRNDSVRDWIVHEVIAGPMGVGDPAIDGLFIDDYWCSNLLCKQDPSIRGCPCDDPVQGPTEIDNSSQIDMALSDEDIRDLTLGWNATMDAIQTELLRLGKYTWSLIPGEDCANASPILLDRKNCATVLTEACKVNSRFQALPALFGLNIVNDTQILQLQQDLAFFLLARGPYSYLGWGTWGMTWPFDPEPAHGELPPLPHGVPRPPEIDRDYGSPLGVCSVDQTKPGVFSRAFTRSLVSLDCVNFVANITLKA